MYKLMPVLLAVTVLSGCTTTEIDECRQGTTSRNGLEGKDWA